MKNNMEFELRTNARYFKNRELLDDLKKVARLYSKEAITQSEYNKKGQFTHKTFCRRFGSWNNALKKAGLKIEREMNIPDEELYENLEKIWIKLGRQPFYSEIKKPASKYCVDVYCRRFGGWMKACEAFIRFKKKDPKFAKLVKVKSKVKTRTISERMRLKIFKRDGYKCVVCGKSPATNPGTILHVDHVIPYSKGGDSSFENLRTLCQKCNLGKGNVDL